MPKLADENLRMLSLLPLQLLVGSDDYDIRVFKNDEMIAEISEVEVRAPTKSLSLPAQMTSIQECCLSRSCATIDTI